MSTPVTLKAVGQRIPLADGLEKVTGKAKFAADVSFPGLLYARPILSPYAHARITSIDKSAALQVPGVVAVITAEDLPVKRPASSRNSAILARDRALFRGQPVAVVLGETEAAAQDGVDAVMIDYDPLPAVVDPVEAMRDDAPSVWPQGLPKGDSMADAHAGAAAEQGEAERQGNIVNTVHFKHGDVEAGFAQADVVIEKTYRTGIVHQAYLEPYAAVVTHDALSGQLTIYTTTQGQFGVRDEVAKLLGLERGKVRVVPMKVGGGFGAKYGVIEPLVAACAVISKRPVKMVLSRTEDFLATTPTPATVFELKTGAKKDGTLTAIQSRVVVDTGAFPFGLHGIIAILLGGYYKFANMDIEGFEVVTNKPAIGAYRAPGSPQATFAIESQMNEMADALGLDPLQFRLQNAVETGDMMPNGQPWPHIGLKLVLEQIAQHPLWTGRTPSANGQKRGVGFAVGGWPGGTSPASAVCRPDSDGMVNIHIGSVDISGSNNAMIAIAAEILGVDPSKIRIIAGDTDSGPYAPPSGGSQITYTVGAAVKRAAEEARKQLLEAAAELFEASVDDMQIQDGQVSVKGVPNKQMSIGQVAGRAMSGRTRTPPILGQGGSSIKDQAPGFAAHLVEVAIDGDTGELTLERDVVIQDVGRAINPLIVEGQIHGGASQSVGYAILEEMRYDEGGQLLSASFMDYAMPLSNNMPDFEVVMVENPTPDGPFGARGIGEPPIIAAPAAIANAVQAATGVRITDLPITAEKLHQALHNGQ
ncbi:MAG: xanthine dehydrogenase family protein molybdopterin-binding subunit [Anaerolineae bacterium]|nr:xanthine dehydrogenase family protein molybdopterin-binding subunit [Anaerolineae bacterium]